MFAGIRGGFGESAATPEALALWDSNPAAKGYPQASKLPQEQRRDGGSLLGAGALVGGVLVAVLAVSVGTSALMGYTIAKGLGKSGSRGALLGIGVGIAVPMAVNAIRGLAGSPAKAGIAVSPFAANGFGGFGGVGGFGGGRRGRL